MNILFLDIDGVLCHNRCKTLNGVVEYPDPACILRINRLLRETDLRIVFHSSWVYHHSSTFLAVWFARNGGDGTKLHFTHPTAKAECGDKATGIVVWLTRYASEVDNFIILDDEWMVDGADKLKGHQVKVSNGWFGGGMQDEHVEQCKELLRSLQTGTPATPTSSSDSGTTDDNSSGDSGEEEEDNSSKAPAVPGVPGAVEGTPNLPETPGMDQKQPS